jgi:hypothetical protein
LFALDQVGVLVADLDLLQRAALSSASSPMSRAMADETMRCWRRDAPGLLRATLPFAISSFNRNIEQSRKLFTGRLITDVGAALEPFHEGETVTGQEQIAACRIVAGVTAQSVDALCVELGAISVARALLLLRELIQRLRPVEEGI